MEIWKPVVGYEGFYEVSSKGKVKSVARTVERVRKCRHSGKTIAELYAVPEKVLRVAKCSGGYLSVSLCKNSVITSMSVHTLVLISFVGAPPPGMVALHDDDNPENNSIVNLSWGTQQKNVLDAIRKGRHRIGQDRKCAKFSNEDIVSIRGRSNVESTSALALEYNVNRTIIRRIIRRELWKHVA